MTPGANIKTKFQSIFLIFFFCFSLLSPSFIFADEAPEKKEENAQSPEQSTKPTPKKSEEFQGYHLSPPLIPSPEEYGFLLEKKETSPSTCGNGIVEAEEACDDGNEKNGDGCSSACEKESASCGNGVVEKGEDCGESGLPPCLTPQKCESCVCSVPKAVCGNGNIEEGEECGEPRQRTCPLGYECNNCKCKNVGGSVCGNGVPEEGEGCNEPGLSCRAGTICNTQTCRCVTAGCGNGIAESGETCGEPSLPECPGGLMCQRCACVQSGCDFFTCSDSRCQVRYCRDTSGTSCTWGSVEAKNFSDSEQRMYDSGTIAVPECCAQVSYQAFVNYSPCTGEVISGSYDIRATITSGGGANCVCPIQEEGAGGSVFVLNGQIVGCAESIDPARAATVDVTSSGGSPRLTIHCSDCCGSSRTVEKTIRSASPGQPVSCSHPSGCPT